MQHTAQLLWDLSIVRIVGDWTQTGTQTEGPNHDLSYPFVIVNRYVFSVFSGRECCEWLPKGIKGIKTCRCPERLVMQIPGEVAQVAYTTCVAIRVYWV